MDRINCLPDEVICHILSFLPMKVSALTSVLSKRWRNLFALTPQVQLVDVQESGSSVGQSFVDFVDRVLNVPDNVTSRKISIRCRKSIDPSHVTRWISDVVKRGVFTLDIDVTSHRGLILVPLEIFTCKTLVELKLAQGFVAWFPEGVSLPSLKTLYIHEIWFPNYDYQHFVLGNLGFACPVLEELTILGWSWQLDEQCRTTVSSSTLKKLTFNCKRTFVNRIMSFDTPNVAFLEYSDTCPKEFPVVNLESLVEAKLDIGLYHAKNPRNLINGLRNVKVLELSSIGASQMFYEFREAIPEFPNLSRLTITVDLRFLNWESFTILLNKSPNLHTLVIKGPLYAEQYELEDEDSSLADPCELEYGLPVRVLEITEYGGKSRELEQMKLFLERLSCLELVKVRARAINDMEKLQVTNDLLSVARSSKCNMKINPCEETN